MAGQDNRVESATPAKPLTREERRARFVHLREQHSVSPLKVTGDPSKAYYWARKDSTAELSRLQFKGFEIVHDDVKSPKIQAAGRQLDGTYIMGDVILMHIDKELYEFFKDENLEKGENRLTQAEQDFIGEAAKQGVPTFERGEKAGAKGVKTVFVPQS